MGLLTEIAKFFTGILKDGAGNIIYQLGMFGEQVFTLGIMLGIFLLKFKNTSVVRRSFLYYLLSIFIEILGKSMMK